MSSAVVARRPQKDLRPRMRPTSGLPLIQVVSIAPAPVPNHPMLRRVLGVPLLVGYGLGVIIGAGIYVLVGPVVAVAGPFAPLSFLLAGVVAALAGLCYAELASRFPEAAGAAAYVKEAFGSDLLSRLIGLAVGIVTLTSTAAVARGSVGYAQAFFAVPMPVIVTALVAACTLAACFGVRESLAIAAGMTMIEVGGLLAVVAAGLPDLPPASGIVSDLPSRLAQFDPAAVIAGAFLSFFAYIGFENLANMAEEAREGERTLPNALLLSLAVSTALYVLVATVASGPASVGSLPAEHAALLLDIGARSSWFSADAFAAVALVAVSNGVLIEILMLSRLLYGMARRGWLPAWLGTVYARTATPLPATLVAGAAVFGLSISFDTAFLAGTTSAITLVVFTVVSMALWRLKRLQPRRSGFAVPSFVPPLAAALCLGLAMALFLVG